MSNYRSKKLLDLARKSNKCMLCDNPNDGTIVAAHSNQIRDGKGRGIKAHDYRIAYLCYTCHSAIDQGSQMSREERQYAFEESHRKTIDWLFQNNHLVVK